MNARIASKALSIALALLSASLAQPARTQSAAPTGGAVGLELVLLIDVSASVNTEEFRLQAQGFASAFRSETVLDAIRGAPGGLAVSVIQWANGDSQQTAIEWTMIADAGGALRLADELAAMPRLIEGGHTALGDALAAALEALENNAFEGLRRVIDLSGDGRTNDGRPLRTSRALVIEQGITINGLAILNELPLLESYFRDHLIGGDGAFVMTAADYVDFARAITEKLAREIQSIPVTRNLQERSTRFARASKSHGPATERH